MYNPKEHTDIKSRSEDAMRPEYDSRGGIRGHAVKIYDADGTVEIHEYPQKTWEKGRKKEPVL